MGHLVATLTLAPRMMQPCHWPQQQNDVSVQSHNLIIVPIHTACTQDLLSANE